MRRTIALFTTMTMMVLLAASVALAATVTCSYSGICDGTNYADTLTGGRGNNTIFGYDGSDTMYGKYGNDSLLGSYGDDRLYGGPGNDYLSGYTGNDTYVSFVLPTLIDTSKGESGYDQVHDYGGSDRLDMSFHERSDLLISWVDTSDADVNRDALRIQLKGTTDSVLVRNYFDNQGGTGRGGGAIETIKYRNSAGVVVYDLRFPIPQG